MADDLASLEFFLAQEDAQEGALARAVAADKTDFHVVDQRKLCVVEEHLVPVTFGRVFEL